MSETHWHDITVVMCGVPYRYSCDSIHERGPFPLSFVECLPLKIGLECEIVQYVNYTECGAKVNWLNCPDQMSWTHYQMKSVLDLSGCWVALNCTCGRAESCIHHQTSKFKMFRKTFIFSLYSWINLLKLSSVCLIFPKLSEKLNNIISLLSKGCSSPLWLCRWWMDKATDGVIEFMTDSRPVTIPARMASTFLHLWPLYSPLSPMVHIPLCHLMFVSSMTYFCS